MDPNKRVISILVQKFRLQMVVNPQSTIKEVLQSMHENNFLSENLSIDDVVVLNKKTQILSVDDKAERAIIDSNQPIHFLEIKRKAEMKSGDGKRTGNQDDSKSKEQGSIECLRD